MPVIIFKVVVITVVTVVIVIVVAGEVMIVYQNSHRGKVIVMSLNSNGC